MNNGYNFNFNPSFMRNVSPIQMMPYQGIPTQTALPRISSLFGNAKAAGAAGAANASKITFSGILNGASKTLGVINQAIPVFYQVKPIWNNARTMFKVVKGLNSKDNTPIKTETTTTNKTNNTKSNQNKNTPTFFI